MLANFGLIFLCIAAGYGLRRFGKLPASASGTLNVVAMNVSLPAVTLLSLHELHLGREIFYPASMAWIFFGASFVFFSALAKSFGWTRPTLGALILTGGLCNTSFVGFPLLTAIYGPGAIRIGVLADQLGSFLVLSSWGVMVATSMTMSARGASICALPGTLLRFPPFIAMIFAFALQSWAFPKELRELLEKIAGTLIPIALVSVGLQLDLKLGALRRYARELAFGLAFKLFLGPALILAVFVGLCGARGTDIQVTIAEAAMAPMITGAILAAEHGLDPELANLMITIGIPISLLTVPIWAHFIAWV